MRERMGAAVLITAVAVLLFTGVVGAHEEPAVDDGVVDNAKATHSHDSQQHGGDEGHLPAGSSGVELVSKLELRNVEPGKIADVGVLGDHAYLAAWGGETCKYNGVHVVDISDVAAPVEVAFIQAKEGSYPGEGVQALPIDTPWFDGDVLVTNNEQCKPGVGFGGLNIYDVTNPAAPVPLTVGFGDDSVPGQGKKDAHEIHSVFAWDAGDRAYAVIVDNEEEADVDIVDISDPKAPTFIAEYDLDAQFPQITDHLGTASSFHHDVVVERFGDRYVMLVSYWDGGYVKLDVTDPANATYIADSDFPLNDPEMLEEGVEVAPEGNAHQAEFSLDGDYIVAADEDFAPVTVQSTVVGGGEFEATIGDNVTLEPGDRFTGPVRYVGRGCDVDPAVPAVGDNEVALIERGLCTFAEKVQNAQDAGYVMAIVFNNTAECENLLNMTLPGPTIPALFVGRDTAFGFMGVDGDPCVAVPEGEFGQLGATVDVTAVFDGWGYAHLYANSTGTRGKKDDGKLVELDTYAVPEAHDPAYASGSGDLSIHEVAMSGQRNEVAYFSYYAAGFRVAEIVDDELVETGWFIDEGGNNFWGVEVFESGGVEYVAASDRDFGLYIFRYTGSAASARP